MFIKRPDQLWDPPYLLFTEYGGFFPGVKLPGRDVDHFHLVQRLMNGAICFPPFIPEFRGRKNFTLVSLGNPKRPV